MDGKLISTTRRKAFIIGFRTAANSLIGVSTHISKEYNTAKYVLSFKLSQDHIETLFSKIRSKGGYNNNPDVINFKSAMRALLVKSDISPSPNANCVELDTSGTGSIFMNAISKKKNKTPSDEDVEEDFEDEERFDLEINITKPVVDISQYIG